MTVGTRSRGLEILGLGDIWISSKGFREIGVGNIGFDRVAIQARRAQGPQPSVSCHR